MNNEGIQFRPQQIEGQEQLFDGEQYRKMSEASALLTEMTEGEPVLTGEKMLAVNDLTQAINQEEIRMLGALAEENDLVERKNAVNELLALVKAKNILTGQQGELLARMIKEEFQGIMPSPLIRTIYKKIATRLEQRETENRAGFFDLMLIDMNGMKAINDRYGHSAGDRAIALVAQAIRESVRAEDLAGRWGGDEFMVLFEGVAPEKVRLRAEAIKSFLKNNPLDLEDNASGQKMSITVSVGIGIADSRKLSHNKPAEEEFFDLADKDLYREKRERIQKSN